MNGKEKLKSQTEDNKSQSKETPTFIMNHSEVRRI